MKADLTIGFLDYAEKFILKNRDNISIKLSENVNERFNFGQIAYNSLINNLLEIKILKKENKDTFYFVEFPNDLTIKQFIFFKWVIYYQPSWMRRFKNGIRYLEDFQESNKNIYQCIKECDVFEEHKSQKTQNFIYKIKASIYSNDLEQDKVIERIEKGRLGERLSLDYERKKTGLEPIHQSLIDDNSGYDIRSHVKDITKRIEVKLSQNTFKPKAFITWNEWKVAKRSLRQNSLHEFHFWRKKDDRWQLAILDAKELEFINFEDKDEHGHHWQTFELLMNAFEENFKETNYSTPCD